MPVLPIYTASIAPRLLNNSITANASAATLQAICAWPVSGQYGPGTRILYYVLVAACILGRGSEWLRGACLAAALLLPAVAALHGIVLAAVHVEDAVDMDMYGAFQLCAIGILAGPATVKMSKTYFNTPGRNLIFLWTGLILSGLLSLTVESFRTNSRPSPASGFENGMPNSAYSGFPFCDEDTGPVSPLRRGSQNNIYIIEAPHVLTFGTVTLLSAACCIYAILQIVSMWDTILKLNWKKRFGDEDDDPDAISNKNMHKINDMIRLYLRMIEIPLFSAAVLAILIVGEMNFFSPSMVYMSEPMASVGQWAPIVGTGLAAMGSLYALLAAGEGEGANQTNLQMVPCHCTCSHHRSSDVESVKASSRSPSPANEEEEAEAHHVENRVESASPRRPTIDSIAFSHPSSRLKQVETTHTTADHDLQPWSTGGTSRTDPASRIKFGKGLQWLGNKLGQAAPETYDDLRWRDGQAADFPTIPGEEERNAALPQIKASYNLPRETEGHGTPSNLPRRTRSRAGSFNGSFVSGLGIKGISGLTSPDEDPIAGPSRPPEERHKKRRSTLEVPKHTFSSGKTHRESCVDSDIGGDIAADASQQTPTSPTITVSPGADA